MKRQLRTTILLIASLVAGISSSIAFAHAAFEYNKQYVTPVDYNAGLFASYFAGGNGQEASPYLLTTPDHLRNLQKLNVLGVFGKNTYFKLDDSIPSTGLTWSGEPLLPIGSEDYPFYSQFNGNGKRINRLLVNGNQTNDVGMFGYVAHGANVENLILFAPSIYVGYNNPQSGTGSATTTNPFDAVLKTSAQALTMSLVQKGVEGNATAFFRNLTTTVTGGGVTYHIEYTSSDTTLLEYNPTTNIATVKDPFDQEGVDFFPVQLTARVYGEYNKKIISYTLERWQINVTPDGNVNVDNPTEEIKVGYWKNIHDVNTTSFGPHGLYVGFFIGHLDGDARNLGLNGGTAGDTTTVKDNGKIFVNGRVARSYTTLIGRSLNDNSNDDANAKFIKRYFDFDTIIAKNDPVHPFPTTPPSDPTWPTTLSASNINNYYAPFNNNSLALSRHYGVKEEELGYFRYYPDIRNTSHTDSEGTKNAITLNAGLRGDIINKREYFLWVIPYDVPLYSYLKNGIWIFLSSDNPGFSSLTQKKQYEAEITIRYVASGSTANKFQIMYNSALNNLSRYGSSVYSDLATASGSTYVPRDVVQLDSFGNPISGVVTQKLKFIFNFETWGFQSGYSLALGLGVGSGSPSITQTAAGAGDAAYRRRSLTYGLTTPFSLKILDIDFLFTSINGNVSRQINNVDFINNFPSYQNGTWVDWNPISGVRGGFNVNAINQSVGYRYYRSASNFFGESTVYGVYSSATYPILNDAGYIPVSSSQGSVVA